MKDLAKGFIKVAKKEVKKATELLVEKGRDAAQSFVCDAIEARTGLPNNICNRAADFVIDEVSKEIREKIKK